MVHNHILVIFEYKTFAGLTDSRLSQETIADWYNYARECILLYYAETEEKRGQIGGVGRVVQVDESKIGKRKNDKGRRVEGRWIIGTL